MNRSWLAALVVVPVIAGCGGAADGGPDGIGPLDFSGIEGLDWGGEGAQPDGEDVADQGPNPCGAPCPLDRPHCDSQRGVCVECKQSIDCSIGICLESECREDLVCVPGEKGCRGNVATVCSEDGTSFLKEESCGFKVCYQAECLECIPGSLDCASASIAQVCRLDGSGWDQTDCGDLKCVNGMCRSCIPGHKKCEDTRVLQCQEDAATWAFLEDCDTEKTGKICHLGMCVQLCELNAKFKTNQGCEYWAIDMDNYHDLDPTMDGQSSPYAIVVSNTNAQFTATITIEKHDVVVKTVEAPPNTATPIWLEPYDVAGALKVKRSFKLRSTLPIVAYQFNPLENVGVYSNDASLLLPLNALGEHYMALSWPTIGYNAANQLLASNVAIVAASGGKTRVKVRVPVPTLSGAGLPALKAGQDWEVELEQFEVVNLEASEVFGDLTGTRIDADQPIAVFSGHVCATAPISRCVGGKCTYDPGVSCFSDDSCPSVMACDHMEEQLPPLPAWGQNYVIPRLWPRGNAPDVIRVLAAEDDTHVQVAGASVSVPTLDAGQYHEFEVIKDIQVTADRAILVGQYMEGQDAPYAAHASCVWGDIFESGPCEEKPPGATCECVEDGMPTMVSCATDADCSPGDANIGDPSFVLGVPVEQFRKEYVFLVPPKYSKSYVNVIARPGTVVELDDAIVDASKFAPVGPGEWTAARMPLAAGSHRLEGDKPVGLVVYGWDRYVSYGYPGGMSTETLNVW